MRVRLSLALSLAVALALAVPAGAQVNDPVTVPPPLEPAPGDARYVDPSFTAVISAADVPYGQAVNSRGELQTLLLDLYEPAGDDEEQFRPAIVWAHGGYMRRGEKTDVQFMPHLVRRGYVGVSITYRVRPELPHGFEELLISSDAPQNIDDFTDAVRDAYQDMLAAVRWLRANAAELRVDPNQIVVAGHSAGGFVAFGAVFNHEDEGDSGNPGWPSHVAASLPSAGGYGPGPSGRAPLPGDAPALVTHGTHDLVVPIFASTLPCVSTMAVGNVCEQRLYPGAGHGLSSSDRADTAADFLWRHVLTADRFATELVGVTATGHGGTVTVTGRLVTEEGEALAGARVLGRATAGWADTATGPDGSFTLVVDSPDHGRATEVVLRYEGHSTGSWLDAPHVAPTHTTVTATWGGGPPA